MLQIKRYETVEECFAAFFRIDIKNVSKGKWEFSRSGKKHKWTMKKVIRVCKESGIWGWCERKNTLHLWISSTAKQEDIIELIAHEIGHTVRPYHKNRMKEEIKAEKYGDVAKIAFQIMLDLIKVDK